MLKNNIFLAIRNLFSREERIVFTKFRDPLGNFEIFYPKKWRFDKDVAVVDGKYTISFESRDGSAKFVVAVDASLPKKFNFDGYAKKELESPSSGICASIKKTKFKTMPSYRREYRYTSSGKDYFGGGIMFFTGTAVFSLSWSAPEKQQDKFEAMFNHMLEKLMILQGFNLTKM